MFINQFRKEGIGEKAYIYCQRFIQQLKYGNRCHLTWWSYEHLWLVCYGHILFCHKRHIMCTRLLHIRVSKNSWFFEKCSYSALWSDSCQLYFHISDRGFFYWKFPFLQLLISNNFSCNVHALILHVYQSLCWKWLQAQMLQCCCNSSVKSKKKSCFSSVGRATANIAVANHWARKMRSSLLQYKMRIARWWRQSLTSYRE